MILQVSRAVSTGFRAGTGISTNFCSSPCSAQ